METTEPRKARSIVVSEVMTLPHTTCRDADTLAVAFALMRDRGAGWLPVGDRAGKCVGVLTARDACVAALERGCGLDSVPIATAMRATVQACGRDDVLEDLLATMQHYRVDRVPVVDGRGMLVGVVSLGEVASHAGPELALEVTRTLAVLHQAHIAASRL
jgi:CBS domain-containing protein